MKKFQDLKRLDVYYIPDITIPELYLRCVFANGDLDEYRNQEELVCFSKEEAIEKGKLLLELWKNQLS
jgi:hypothetical protein